MSKNIKNLTKTGDWQITTEKPTREDLTLSCLMRIADAMDVIATDYRRNLKDLEFYERGFRQRATIISDLQRSNSALRGAVTRMKNKEKKQR